MSPIKHLAFLLVLLTFSHAHSSIIFQDDFDDCTSGCTVGSSAPNSAGWLQWMQSPPNSADYGGVTHNSGEITSPGRGGAGRSLKLWRAGTLWMGSSGYAGPLVNTSGGSYSDFYMRFYAKIPVDFSPSGTVMNLKMWRFNTSAGEIYVDLLPTSTGVHRDTMRLTVQGRGSRTVVIDNTQLKALWDGNWHAWQLRFNLTGGTVSFWADGVLVADSVAIDGGMGGSWNSYMQHFPLGNMQATSWQSSWQSFEVDDLVMATTKAETDPVAAGPDVSAPTRSSGAPTGILQAGTTSTTMSLATDEAATCKYSSTAGTAYASMSNTFSTTGGATHSVMVSGLQNGTSYTRYVRCSDGFSNANSDDYIISWSVASPSAGIVPGNVLFSESFEDNSWASRGWYDGTTSTGSTAGGYFNNGLRWAWDNGANQPTGFTTLRNTIPSRSEFMVEYWIMFEPGWEGTHVNYHPHMIHFLSTADTAYQSLSATQNSLYVEAIADTTSPYAIRPSVSGQDTYRVNTSSGTPPNNLVSTTETRSAYHCNTPYTLTDATGGTCYSLGGGYYYSMDTWTAQSVTIPTNTWVRVRAYFKRNTFTNNLANFDGIIRVWVNDTLAAEDTGVLFAANAYSTTSWDKIALAPWIGDGSPKVQAMWIDELKVYDGYTGGATNYCYADADNDLYGTGSYLMTTSDCSTGYYSASHFTSTTGDCDDNNAAINPGGTDICGSTDRNCNGSIDACPAARVRWGSGSVGWGTGTTGQ